MSQQTTDLPDTISPRRFEYADDKSYKFWTISLNGLLLTTRFGRIGSQGQSREVRFGSIDAAKADYAKRIRQKLRAGYEERVAPKRNVVTADEVWQRLEDHEPFIQAILDDPDEIAGYAVYADWLVERDDPQGEFTQLQLALEDPMLALYKRPKVENAAKLLRQKHVRHWLGNLAPWLMDYGIASYPYEFLRGQLASIACYVLGLRFADELRRSPHCRMLREFSIQSTEVVQETMAIDGRRFEAGRDYGLETLVGADFSNLREFRVGALSDDISVGQSLFTGTSYLLELIESMPRLETLCVRADIDLRRLLQMELPHLTALHVTMKPDQISILSQSNMVPRLQTLGFLTPLTPSMVTEIVRIPGFDELTEFTCGEFSHLPRSAMEKLKATGVVIRVPNYL